MTTLEGNKYVEALQNPALTLTDPTLKKGQLVKKNARPFMSSGQFAITFKFQDSNQQTCAVRCFVRMPNDLQERYSAISAFINANRAVDLFTPFEYQHEGIRIDGKLYPILKMDWVNGERLINYIQNKITDPSALVNIADEFRLVVKELKRLGCSHGDLQHENILVQNGKIKLVDFDGMFVPALSGKHASEAGLADFQHPQRQVSPIFFNDRLDHFSSISIYLSLLAIARCDKLYLGDDKTILLKKADYVSPNNSPRFSCLDQLGFSQAITELRKICSGSLSEVPTLEQFITTTGLSPLPRLQGSVPVTCARVTVANPAAPKAATSTQTRPIVQQKQPVFQPLTSVTPQQTGPASSGATRPPPSRPVQPPIVQPLPPQPIPQPVPISSGMTPLPRALIRLPFVTIATVFCLIFLIGSFNTMPGTAFPQILTIGLNNVVRASSAYFAIGISIAALTLLYFIVQRGQGVFTRFVLPMIIGTSFSAAIYPQVKNTLFGLSFHFVYPNTVTAFIPFILLTAALVLPALLIRRIIWRMLITPVVLLFAAVSLELINGARDPTIQPWLILTSLVLGAIPWIPELFYGEKGSLAVASKIPPSAKLPVPDKIRRRAIAYRTLGLGLPLLIGWYVAFGERQYSDIPTGWIESLLFAIPMAYAVNRFIIEPFLQKTVSGFLFPLLRAVLFIGIQSALIGLFWQHIVLQNYTRFLSEELAVKMATAGIIVALIMVLSASSGITRRTRIFRTILYIALLIIFPLLIFPTMNVQNRNTTLETKIILAIGGGLCSAILTVPTWSADWLAKRSYE